MTRLYENVLGRAPDAEGLAYWVRRLATGTSCASVVVGFSESLEHRARTAGDTTVVARWFGLHRRVPTRGVAADWAARLAARPATDLVGWLLLSPDHPAAVG